MTDRSTEKRAQILGAAVRVFAAKGYHAVAETERTVTDVLSAGLVAEDARVSA